MKSNEQLLYEAVRRNDLKEARTLIAIGVEPNWQDSEGMAPLHHAAARGFTELLDLLLQHPRIKIDLADDGGATALHHAAKRAQPAAALKLVSKGANIEAQDIWLSTPLMTAAHSGDEDTVAQLLRLKADVKAQDARGRGALHYSVVNDNLPATKLLLQAGADPRVEDHSGISPAKLARKAAHRSALEAAMAKYYFRYGAGTDLQAPPRAAFRKKNAQDKSGQPKP